MAPRAPGGDAARLRAGQRAHRVRPLLPGRPAEALVIVERRERAPFLPRRRWQEAGEDNLLLDDLEFRVAGPVPCPCRSRENKAPGAQRAYSGASRPDPVPAVDGGAGRRGAVSAEPYGNVQIPSRQAHQEEQAPGLGCRHTTTGLRTAPGVTGVPTTAVPPRLLRPEAHPQQVSTRAQRQQTDRDDDCQQYGDHHVRLLDHASATRRTHNGPCRQLNRKDRRLTR